MHLMSAGWLATYGQPITTKADDDKFGKLPPNQISTWELSGVRTEIAIGHFVDPLVVREKLPLGFRPQTVGEFAKNDPGIAKWLEDHPRYSGYLVATLLFTSLDLVVDGANVSKRGPVRFADWWIWGTAAAPLDKVALGDVALQLASWLPDTGISRAKLAADPTISFGKVEVVNTKPGEWQVRLKIRRGEITGEVHEQGERTEIKYPLPAYSTIFLAGSNPSRYAIFTYYGHHLRDVKASWKFTGNHLLTRSLSDMKAIYPFRTVIQDGWRARAGLYKAND